MNCITSMHHNAARERQNPLVPKQNTAGITHKSSEAQSLLYRMLLQVALNRLNLYSQLRVDYLNKWFLCTATHTVERGPTM